MNRDTIILDIFRRLNTTFDSYYINRAVQSPDIEAERYGIKKKTFLSYIKIIKDYYYDIALNISESLDKANDMYYYTEVVYNRKRHCYQLKDRLITLVEFRSIVRDKNEKKTRRSFIQKARRKANES